MKRNVGLSLALLAALTLVDAPASASEKQNKELVKRYVEICLDGGELECFSEFWAEDRASGARKSEEFRRSFFPDLSYELVEMIAEGDRVVVLFSVTGTHHGEAPSRPSEGKEPVPPSHNMLQVDEAVFYTVTDGLIQTGRVISDKMEVAKALGYTVEPPGAE